MPHKLSLVVPGLCGPLPALDGLETAAMPLVELLKQFGRARTAGPDYPMQLAELFGLDVTDGFPSAPLTLLAHDIQPGEYCWIHADPVNLQADMDRAILSDSQTLQISRDEAEQLVQELNTHFGADALNFVMADENNWLLRLEHCALTTTPLRRAVGRNINPLLPSGDDAAQWNRTLNEVQMLLHISEVNQQREQRGLAPVNSLWLWGQGVLPQPGRTDITHVYADDNIGAGIARLNNIKQSALTDPITLTCAMQHDGHSLVIIDRLDGPCNYGDAAAWLDAMLEVVDDWLQPLLATAKSLDADVNIYPCNSVRYHFAHNNKLNISQLMFWKKDQLGDYVDTQ